jgi:hypothetical protein
MPSTTARTTTITTTMADTSESRRRDSLSRSAAAKQRPKLLRSSVTEPSITAANAIKGALVAPTSPQRAAEILSKMAAYHMASSEPEMQMQSHLIQHQPDTVIMMDDNHGRPTSAHNNSSLGTLSSGLCSHAQSKTLSSERRADKVIHRLLLQLPELRELGYNSSKGHRTGQLRLRESEKDLEI